MNIVRAAVVSENKDIIRFFSLELQMIDVAVDIYTPDQRLTSDYDLVIVDTDTALNGYTIGTGVIVRVSSNVEQVQGCADPYMIPWPVSIERIHEICLGLIHGGGIQQNIARVFADISNIVYVSDEHERVISIDDIKIKLSVSEYRLLERLCMAHGDTVSREEIMEILGAQDGNISDVYICRLRKKLETPLGRKLIFTERNVGYRTSLVWGK